MSRQIDIVIADDHDMVRQGLAAIISTFQQFNIVSTAKSGREVLDLLEYCQPDIVLLDIIMPDMNGLEVAKKIKHRNDQVKILMLSMEVSSEYVKQAFKYDIEGYIPKNAGIKVLSEAIEMVATGHKYYDQEVKDYIFKFFVGEKSLAAPKVDNLSEREVQILKLISNGKTNKLIGEQLFISPKTVEAHRNNILKKLHLRSTADLVKFAIAKNITDIPKEMML